MIDEKKLLEEIDYYITHTMEHSGVHYCYTKIKELVCRQPKVGEWIPVSERLPEKLEPVNITWVYRNPAPYYASIKDKSFTGIGLYDHDHDQWFWFLSVCAHCLEKYGYGIEDIIDDDINVIAWQPLPEPYKGEL